MTRLSDRHSGDLAGQLVPGAPASVAVYMPVEPTVSDQHAAWMLINLLVRLKDVVHKVILVGPEFAIAERVSPHAKPGTSFASTAAAMASLIGGAAVEVRDETSDADLRLHVGAGPAPISGWRLTGHGWRAVLSRAEVPPGANASTLPFGPYAAACLAAAEIFRVVRLPTDRYVAVESLELDLWDCGIATGVPAPVDVAGVALDFGLAGVGAVGVAVLHALWACESLAGCAVIADNDRHGVDDTNLNRYILFDRRHIGGRKATTASEIYGAGQIDIHPIDGPYDLEHLGNRSPRVLLSAVDSNESRHDLQRGLVPGVAFGASTEGLRAELTVIGPAGEGPCLACHNTIVEGIPDDVRRAQVREMHDDQLAAVAARVAIPPHAIREWAETGKCGLVNPEEVGHVLEADSPAPAWSVGFVSVFAGVMLAAQLIRYAVGHAAAAEGTSTKFQFRLPQAHDNGSPRPQLRDARCAICSNDVHRQIWASHR